jgi:hypothetical protein
LGAQACNFPKIDPFTSPFLPLLETFDSGGAHSSHASNAFPIISEVFEGPKAFPIIKG